MDSVTQLFIDKVLNRFEQMVKEIPVGGDSSLIAQNCKQVRQFLTQRQKHQLFKDAKGTRFIRRDFHYYIPLGFGFDIRPFLKGEALLLDVSRLETCLKKEYLSIDKRQLLKAVSQLVMLVSTYNLYQLPIREIHKKDPELKLLVSQALLHKKEIFLIMRDYLRIIISPSQCAKSIKLGKDGDFITVVDSFKDMEFKKQTMSAIYGGEYSLKANGLDRVFSQLCSPDRPTIKQTILLDPKHQIEADMQKIAENALSSETMEKIMSIRYSSDCYLLAASLDLKKKKDFTDLKQTLKDNIQNFIANNPDIEMTEEEVEVFADFLAGAPPKEEDSFFFDELEGAALDWKKAERRSVYIGEAPKSMLSPEHLPLPDEIKTCEKRPIVALLDVSGSMYPIDLAIEAVKSLYWSCEGHPFILTLFSSYAGILNQGIPVISDGRNLPSYLRWLPDVINSLEDGLGGATSIGNGILLASRIAKGISTKMDKFQEWKKSGVCSHVVMVSDNYHNTERNISEIIESKYSTEKPENVVYQAADEGCSIHNMIYCYGTESDYKGVPDLLRVMQEMKHRSTILKSINESAMTKIASRIQVINEDITDGGRFMTVEGPYEQFRIQTKVWSNDPRLNQTIPPIKKRYR